MNNNKKIQEIPNPRATAGILSSLTYAWTTSIFKTAYHRDLETSDLYATLNEHSSGLLGDTFSNLWNKELRKGSPSLLKVIYKCFKWQILLNLFLTFILECGIRVLQPIIFGRFILYFDPFQKNISKHQLYLYAFGLVSCSTIGVLMSQSISMSLMHMGLKIKVGCCSLLYRKALKLSKTSLGENTVGHVINLLSNDMKRMEMLFSLINYLIIGPLQFMVVTYWLWRAIGEAALIGVLIILAFVPIQIWLGELNSEYRKKASLLTDERLQMTNEVISGIKFVKMNAMERVFCRFIAFIRMEEMNWIKNTFFIRAFSVSCNLFIAKFSLLASIMYFVFMGNQITPSKIFVVVCFHDLLKQTLTVFFPRAIHYFSDFMISINQLQKFMLSEETTKSLANSIQKSKDIKFKTSEISKIMMSDNVDEATIPLHIGDNVKEIKIKLPNETDEYGSGNFDKSSVYPDIVIENAICLDNVYVKSSRSSSEFALNNITLKIKTGSFVAIIGNVGAGKGSLFNTILKEVPVYSGNLDIFGEIAYASKESWLFNNSIKNNILFGLKMDKMRYNKVIQKCCLERDLSMMPFGDKTLIDEFGNNLTQGQKARINLARAVYRNADIYLLEDPLSSIDAHVGHQLFDNCFKDYLSGKTILLITNLFQYLREVDHIIILSNGYITAEGSYEHLEKNCTEFKKLLMTNVAPNEVSSKNRVKLPTSFKRMSSICNEYSVDDIPENKYENQSRKSGSVNDYVYNAYLNATGSSSIVWTVFILAIVVQILASSSDFWIAHWINQEEIDALLCAMLPSSLLDPMTAESYPNINSTDSFLNTSKLMDTTLNASLIHADSKENVTSNYCCENFPRSWYFSIYTGVIVSLVTLGLVRSFLFFWAAAKASISLHQRMLTSVTKATMRFFSSNPHEKILNRFSKDLGSVDDAIPQTMIDVLQIGLQMIAIFSIALLMNIWYFVPILFSFGLIIILHLYYTPTSRNIYRLVGITRSPGISHVTATLQGLPTIRAYGQQRILEKEFDSLQNVHTSACYLFIGITRAFGFWVDTVCVIFITSVVWSFSIAGENTLGGNVGLVISQAIGLTAVLQYGMRMRSQLENEMTSVERILDYTDIEHEPPLMKVTDNDVPLNWPKDGHVSFKNVSVRYSPVKAPVIHELSLEFQPQEKVAIIGHSGSGKTSIVNALFRLAFVDGTIEIDGVKTNDIGLHLLRSRLSIIPQDPVLFSGTIRSNLDPYKEFTDDDLWSALEKVQLKSVISELPNGINGNMLHGGTNFSVGQRQLFFIARAIISNSKIIIFDEATSNVDPETDDLIQSCMHSYFLDCTIINIAHRLRSVINVDKVLVMESGRMKEFDHPYILLQSNEGIFHSMVYAAGTAIGDELKEVAEKNYNERQINRDTL